MVRFVQAMIGKPAGLARKNPDAAALCFILLLALLAYGKGLIPGRLISPAGLFLDSYPWRAVRSEPVKVHPVLGDIAVQFHPFQLFAAREVRSGSLPLWNPLTFGGAPFLANMQSGLFCPFNLPSYLLSFKVHLAVSLIMKSFVAGASMYWFLKLLGMGAGASLLGSVAFMFSGFVVAWLGWSLGSTAVWMPLLFAFVERLRRDRDFRGVAWLGLAVGVQFLGGHPETSFHMLVLVCAWVVFRARGQGAMEFAALCAGGIVLGVLLSAVQLVPFLEYVGETSAYYYRSREPAIWTIGLKTSMSYLIPFYFGDTTRGTNWNPEFTCIPEESATVGIVPVILLPCILYGAWRRPVGHFFVAAAFLSALAIYWQPAAVFLSRIPVFSLAANSRLLLWVAFSLAVLSAMGVEAMRSSRERTRALLGIGTAATFICLAPLVTVILAADYRGILLAGAQAFMAREYVLFICLFLSGTLAARAVLRKPWPGNSAFAFLMAVQAASALLFAMRFYPQVKAKEFIPTTPALSFLRGEPGCFRVLLPLPNAGLPYGIADIQGYDGMSPRRIERLLLADVPMGGAGNVPLDSRRSLMSPLLDLLNVKYLLGPPGWKSPGSKYVLAYDGPDGRVFRNKRVLERAFLVPCARVFAGEDAVFNAVNRGTLDFSRRVALVDPAVRKSELRCGGKNRLLSGETRIVRYATDEVKIAVSTAQGAYLVLMDTYFPGWRARLDGRETEILRANFAFRAIRVPPGRHEAVFSYEPVSFKIGLGLTLAGVAAAWMLFAAERAYKRRQRRIIIS